jgi:poly(ADP-ribose) glycohydrolase ARH3
MPGLQSEYSMNTRSAMVDTFRGTLLGGAAGDALGAPFEGARTVDAQQIERVLASPDPLRYTDDTHMTIGLADALIETGRFDGARLAAMWAANYRAEPWRGYGPGPGQVFALHEQGVPWDRAGKHLYGGRGSWGNGAAMRVAPVALLAFDDLEAVAHLARQTAMITHTHRLGVEGAVLQAVAIAILLGQPPGHPLRGEDYLERIRGYVGAAEYCQELDGLPELLAGPDLSARDISRVLGCGVAAQESVVTALYCFLRCPQDFTACIRLAIGLGGDTDTIAAMAGSLAGAHLGEARLPSSVLRRLEGVETLRGQADALLGLVRSRMPMAPRHLGE